MCDSKKQVLLAKGEQGPAGAAELVLNHAEPVLNLLNLLNLRCKMNPRLKMECARFKTFAQQNTRIRLTLPPFHHSRNTPSSSNTLAGSKGVHDPQ